MLKIPQKHWSKLRFSFNSKCDVLVNNMSETFNSVIIGPRGKPIVTMFEDISGYLMERWATNRTKLQAYNVSVLPNIKKKKKLQKECDILPPPLRRLPGRQKRKRNKVGYEKARDSSLVSRKGMPVTNSVSATSNVVTNTSGASAQAVAS